jgi:hypothetical protein
MRRAKKALLAGSVVLVLGLLVAVFATPIFAHGPEDEAAPAGDSGVWETMHEACEAGDWEAMEETAEEVHGDDFASMPCHDDYEAGSWSGMGGHMWDGGGMMGGTY